MRRQLRTESAVEFGRWLASELLEAPVKDAVREALAEERAATREQGDRQPAVVEDGSVAENGSDADTESSTPVLAFVAGLAAVGVVAYLLRRRGQSDDDYPTRPNDVDEETAAGDRVEAEAPVDADG
ncbi:hypothetical protein [Haloarcula onubensis]|uniref:PGF-CTERM sorting domain-containing protein n=1 Tax=Haloarcula onubensis TaxID=2950539 RepID=A0ABU2FV26_9EURY|nr:hypothetical protein [Halomicroarcula sp. S3CR25-11]MDS0284623.1 hypothetical protein [Halomicroarcula sp. S3CR25-11]